jgi:Tfp pilus assembly protein PilN
MPITTGRNGQYSVSALARARNALERMTRVLARHETAPDA